VTEIVLVGAAGRMGRAVMEAMGESPDLRLKACVDRAPQPGGNAVPWGEDAAAFIARGDVVIEFGTAAAAEGAARAAAAAGAGLVSGSTGLSTAAEALLREVSARVPVVRSANFSIGILALRAALNAALAILPEGFDVEIIERHHRTKQDSPSGTALLLATDVARGRGVATPALKHGRQGSAGAARPSGEIGIHAVRGGDWVGDHTLLLGGMGEWLELRHVAQSRRAFAEGALAAARFVARAVPGLYTLEDVMAARSR